MIHSFFSIFFKLSSVFRYIQSHIFGWWTTACLSSNSGRRGEYGIETNENITSHLEDEAGTRRQAKLRDGMLIIFFSKVQVFPENPRNEIFEAENYSELVFKRDISKAPKDISVLYAASFIAIRTGYYIYKLH